MFQSLCGQFKALLVADEEEALSSQLKKTKLHEKVHDLSLSLTMLCRRLQTLTLDDLPTLISLLTLRFQAESMAVSLTENMVDSVDQLFSSLSLGCLAEELHECTDNLSELSIAGSSHVSQTDLDNVCRMMRYIMTADQLDATTLITYLQQLAIL